jgi:hypothetical protein
MAIISAIATSYKAEILQGIHTLSDTYQVALYNSTAILGPDTTTYIPTGECSGGNYPTGGTIVPIPATVEDLNTAILTFNNPTFTNLTLHDVRGCLIYNASKGNKAVACFDFGQSISLFTSDFTLIIPAATASTGLIRFN